MFAMCMRRVCVYAHVFSLIKKEHLCFDFLIEFKQSTSPFVSHLCLLNFVSTRIVFIIAWLRDYQYLPRKTIARYR